MVAEDRKKDKMSSLRAAFKSCKAGKTIQDGCRMEIYEKETYDITGMSCAACSARIEKEFPEWRACSNAASIC